MTESSMSLMACAEIIGGSLERDVSIAVDTMDGTAVAGMYVHSNIGSLIVTPDDNLVLYIKVNQLL